MRGKENTGDAECGCTRITPAYAGKSSGWRWVITISQDHPRLCGEKRANLGYGNKIVGSPPPMRGKVPRSSVILDCVRITPAYAGKSTTPV